MQYRAVSKLRLSKSTSKISNFLIMFGKLLKKHSKKCQLINKKNKKTNNNSRIQGMTSNHSHSHLLLLRSKHPPQKRKINQMSPMFKQIQANKTNLNINKTNQIHKQRRLVVKTNKQKIKMRQTKKT